jgi:hypothetical protein
MCGWRQSGAPSTKIAARQNAADEKRQTEAEQRRAELASGAVLVQ